MYRCESWTIKKAGCWRIDAFELWCWRRPESPLDCKEIQPVHSKGNQSWIFFGRIDAEAEIPMLWPPDVKNWLIGKDPDAGKDRKAGGEGDNRGWDGWMASPTQWTWVWVSSGSWWWTRKPGVLLSIRSQRVGHDWVTEQQQQAGKWVTKRNCAKSPGSKSAMSFFIFTAHMLLTLEQNILEVDSQNLRRYADSMLQGPVWG